MVLRNDEDYPKDVESPNAMDALIKEVQQHPDNLKVGHCPKLCHLHGPQADMLSH